MKTHYLKLWALLICVLIGNLQGMAQELTEQASTDSLNACIESVDEAKPYKPKLGGLAIISGISGVASFLTSNSKESIQQRDRLHRKLVDPRGRHFGLDDYSQYAPMVAAYGLELFGLQPKHNLKERTIILAMSAVTMAAMVNAMKYSYRELRPERNQANSFPSGHTATAFMGAEFLYQEYKDVSPWIGYIGYGVAGLTGYLRIYNNRHYLHDVVAGACIGIISTKCAYWLYPKLFKPKKKRGVQLAGMPYYASNSWGVSVSLTF